MVIPINERLLSGRKLYISQNGTGGPVIFWGMYPHRGNEVEHLRESLMEIAPGQNFMLVAFQVEDWNRDFSPWEAPAMFGTERFSGQGAETLRWLTEECMPYIDQTFDTERRERWLMGYSLAGLFALWAAYECDCFSGIICCSGSLWFQDWDIYVKEHTLHSKCKIYLSLGGREEKTKNKVMATVGERTREQERILRADPLAEQGIIPESGLKTRKRNWKRIQWQNGCFWSGMPEDILLMRGKDLLKESDICFIFHNQE